MRISVDRNLLGRIVGRLICNEQDSLWTEMIGTQSHVLPGNCIQVMRKITKNVSHYWYPYRESERSSFRIGVRSVTGCAIVACGMPCRCRPQELGCWRAYWCVRLWKVQDRQSCVMAALFVLVVRCYQSDLKKEDGKGEKRSTHGKDGESTVAHMGKMGKVL
jgi:hypothetical protein